MLPLPKPDALFTHESGLAGLLARVRLRRLTQQLFGAGGPFQATVPGKAILTWLPAQERDESFRQHFLSFASMKRRLATSKHLSVKWAR
jgi:DNA-binding IclR family transcriptional regulator